LLGCEQQGSSWLMFEDGFFFGGLDTVNQFVMEGLDVEE